MAEENNTSNKEKESKDIVKANIGDMIQMKRGSGRANKGKVIALRENSVIVECGINPNTGEPLKTVVNHKNYKLVK